MLGPTQGDSAAPLGWEGDGARTHTTETIFVRYVYMHLFRYIAFRLNDAWLASGASNYMSWFNYIVITSHPNLLWLRSIVRVVHLLAVLSWTVCVVLLIYVLA